MKAKPYQIDALTQQIQKSYKGAVVFGTDTSVIQDTAEQIALKIVPSLSHDFNVVKISGNQLKEAPFLLSDEGNALSFLGERKLLLVRDADPYAAEALSLFLQQIKTDAFCLIIAGNLSKSSSLRCLAEKETNILAVACYPDNEREIRHRVFLFFQENNIHVSPDDISLITAKLSDNRLQIKSELHKLLLYLGSRKTLKTEDIYSVLSDTLDANTDELCMAIADGSFEKSDTISRLLLQSGETPVSLIRNLMSYFNNILLGIDLIQKKHSKESILNQILKPHQFRLKDNLSHQLSIWTKESVLRVLQLLSETEIQTKTTAYNPELMLSRTILMIASAAKKNSSRT